MALLTACVMPRPPAGGGPTLSPEQARAVIDEAIPKGAADRAGWVTDIYAGFTSQDLAPTAESVCAVVAVIEQESNFQVNPVVPGLGAIAWREIDARAERAGVPRMIVHGALELRSPNGGQLFVSLRSTSESRMIGIRMSMYSPFPEEMKPLATYRSSHPSLS